MTRSDRPDGDGSGRSGAGEGPEEGVERLAGLVLSGVGRVSAAVAGLLLLSLASAILLASQTTAGRGLVAGAVEDALAGAVEGRVEVGPITGGNLVTRVLVDRFRITDREGRVFVDLRGLRVEYSPFSLLAGRYHFRRVTADRVEVVLRQAEGGAWNFDRIFGGDGGEEEGGADGAEDDGGGASVLVTDLISRGGRLEVVTPWDGEPPGTVGAARAGQEEAPAPVWRHERREGRDVRVISLSSLSGSFPVLRLADPDRPMHLELGDVSARAEVVRQPLPVRSLTGSATFGDTVRIQVGQLATAESRLEGAGRVVPGDPTRYRFDLTAEPLAFGELAWLPVPVPGSGAATGDLALEDDGGGLVVGLSGGELRSGDTRVTGSFTLETGPPPRFRSLDLDLQPLRLRLARELTGLRGEIDGYARGPVSGSGPLGMLRVDADLQLDRLPGAPEGAGEGVPSKVALRGGVDLEGGGALRQLQVDLRDFRPAWVGLLGMDLRQRGRVDGSLTLDRARGGPLAFDGDLRLRAPGDTVSRVSGRGTVVLARPGDTADTSSLAGPRPAGGRARMDLSLRADPLSLSVLDPYFPRLRLVGVVRGDVSATGTLDSLRARADLTTPRGALTFDGRFDLLADRRGYDVELTARNIQLRQWIEDGPRTDLDVRGRVEGRGTTTDDLAATFDLEVLPSRFHGARVDSSRLRFTVERGLARVDTFAVRTDAGTFLGRGAFGLSEERSGSLVLTLDAPDLSRWNRWLVAGRDGSASGEADDDLFRRLGAGGEDEQAGVSRPDTLVGSLSARGVLYGNTTDFAFGGTVRAGGPGYGALSADSLRLTLDVADVSALDSLVVAGNATGVRRGGLAADTLDFRVERRGSGRALVDVFARRDTSAEVDAGGSLTWTDARTRATVDRLRVALGPRTMRLEGRTEVTYGDAGLVVDSLRLVGEEGERLAASGTLPRSGPADFSLDVAGLPLGEVGEFLALGPELGGRLSGRLRVSGTAGDPRIEADAAVTAPEFETLGYAALRASARYEARRLRGDLALRAGGRDLVTLGGEVRTDLSLHAVERRLLEEPLDLTLRADSLPARFIEIPLEDMRDVEGFLRGRVGIAGTPDAPRFDGRLDFVDGRVRVVSLGVPYRQIRGAISFEGSAARVDSLAFASAGGGRGWISGTVDFADFGDPGLDLALEARRLRAIERRKVSFVLDGSGRLSGTYRRPSLSGSFRLSDGTVRTEEFARERAVVDLSDPDVYGLVDPAVLEEQRLVARARNPFLQNLRTDVSLRVGPDLWLRSSRLEVELAGELDLRMDRAQEQLTVFGSLTLPRGTFTYRQGIYSRELKISEGQLEFVGTPGIDPNVDVTATHRTRGRQGTLVVRAQVTGRLSAPRIAFVSEPSMSESDQICVLLFNAPCVLAQSSAGRLVAQRGLGVIGSELFSNLVGGQVVDYVQVRSGGPTTTRSQEGDGDQEEEEQRGDSLLGQTEVEIGKYLTPELFLTVTQPLGTPLPTASLDWRFAEHWSLEVRSDYRFGQEFLRTGGSSNIGRDRMWGLFLFREWSF